MADIIVRQANTTSLTVQSSSNQVIVRQQPNNTVVVQTTGNSYVLPPATANTLGGIIVGDNLTINANGLLSATAGAGVSTFNNRTGNVTLTANDVSAVANDLYAKESNQTRINLADGLVPISIRNFGPVVNPSWSFYGTISNQTASGNPSLANGTHVNFIGLHTNNNVDRPYIGKWHKSTTGTETQTALYLDDGINFYSTTYLSNTTLTKDVFFYTSEFGLSFGFTTPTQFASFDMTAADGVFFYSVAQGLNNANPGPLELLTRSAADALYEKIVRRN